MKKYTYYRVRGLKDIVVALLNDEVGFSMHKNRPKGSKDYWNKKMITDFLYERISRKEAEKLIGRKLLRSFV